MGLHDPRDRRSPAPSDVEGGFRGRALRALVVEDDDVVGEALTAALQAWGASAQRAARLDAALAMLAQSTPDLIVLDIQLPDGSGVTVAERALQRRPAPMVVAVSGFATASEAFRLAELGVRGYLPKPVSLRDFTATVEALLSQAPDFVPHLVAAVGHDPFRDVLERVRRAMAEQALALAGGSRTGAARLLGVTRQAVQQLIRDLEIDDVDIT